MKIIATPAMQEAINAGLVDSGLANTNIKNVVFIQSPLQVESGEGTRFSGTFLEVFSLWLEYYGSRGCLNKPWKIIAIGLESEYENLPYYVTACLKGNTWEQVEQLLKAEKVDYSQIPTGSSGKNAVSVFFHGHGEGNLRGAMSVITHYVNNGILHLEENNDLQETEEFFFKPAGIEIKKLKTRLKKYEPVFQYLPWEKEIEKINKMIEEVEAFLKDPVNFPGDYDKLKDLVISSFKGLSELMKIHTISEMKERSQSETAGTIAEK